MAKLRFPAYPCPGIRAFRSELERVRLARQRRDPLAVRAALYDLARVSGQKQKFWPLAKGWCS